MAFKVTSSQKAPDAKIITDIEYTMWKAQIIEAALKLGIWDKIYAGCQTAVDLAGNEGWDVTGTCRLLDALCGIGLLEKDRSLYRLVPVAELYLLSSKSTYMGNLIVSVMDWEGHGRLAEAVRTGRRPWADNWNNARFAALWVESHAPLTVTLERALTESETMWASLGIEAYNGLKTLDVACGTAIKTLALARRHPGVSLTLHDWAPVLEVAKKITQELKLENQITLLPGDVRTVDFGQNRFNVAFLGQIIHWLGIEEVTGLFQKVYLALLPGGSLVVDEVIVDEGRCKRENPLLSAMLMYCVTAQGNIYSFLELKKSLKEAGFTKIKQVGRIRRQSEGYIKAVKP